ncbi:LysM peptidoglycan-binding domain-containing protein [Thalassobacillus pellis]|uniref:LysM peptidoglycan-binding domain-containing protein n=1 Tax=Thalassobacillus pellis TaxID=748008 RepID=UPI00195F5FA2|nr:LysM peptidoglycan-binding domain-containing protein [Thalassobacillus pellis]MBM7553776.1 peptidoglycan/xylan/chitin deacetylase (PgdA/CDA1 family) [Thalassobacillus pellis]
MSRLWKLTVVFSLFFATFLSVTPHTEAAASKFITKGSTTGKMAALTFDDGSDGTNINKILQVLSDHKVKSTFFLTGSGTKNHPQSIKNIAAHGHELANHSYSHPDFTKLSSTQIKSELDRTESIVKSTTGKSTKPLFRAPFGSVNSHVLTAVGNAGYSYSIHWNIDTLDWKGLSKNQVYHRVVNNIVPGSIVLMHTGAGASGTPAALSDIIRTLKSKGYHLVTVSEILKLDPMPSGITHLVKTGDTLYAISRKYGVTVKQIMEANNLDNANFIRIGQLLTIPVAGSPSHPTQPGGSTYTVKAGDTLYSIARRYNVTVDGLVRANNIHNPALIWTGQQLVIPGKTTIYVVKVGDTLYSIARKFGSTVSKIAAANKISNPSLIHPGQALTIPA